MSDENLTSASCILPIPSILIRSNIFKKIFYQTISVLNTACCFTSNFICYLPPFVNHLPSSTTAGISFLLLFYSTSILQIFLDPSSLSQFTVKSLQIMFKTTFSILEQHLTFVGKTKVL